MEIPNKRSHSDEDDLSLMTNGTMEMVSEPDRVHAKKRKYSHDQNDSRQSDSTADGSAGTQNEDEENVETQPYDFSPDHTNDSGNYLDNVVAKALDATREEDNQSEASDILIGGHDKGENTARTEINSVRFSIEENSNATEDIGEVIEEVTGITDIEGKRNIVNKNHIQFENGAIRDKYTNNKPLMKKIQSVQRDANRIADFLGIENIDAVYEKVKQKRAILNRVDVVTNSILEEGLDKIDSQHDCSNQEPCANASAPEEIDLFSDIDLVVKTLAKKVPSMKVDPNEVYALLEQCCDKKDRIGFVVKILLDKRGALHPDGCAGVDQDQASMRLVEDINVVLKRFPKWDPVEVYAMMEEHIKDENRVEIIIDKLTEMSQVYGHNADADTEVESFSQEAETCGDSILREMHMIAKMFPEKDRNEIYAYLEAHHDKPNRIQIVTDELLLMSTDSQGNVRPPYPQDVHDGHTTAPSPTNFADQLVRNVESLKAVFPDCDPDYLFEQLEDKISRGDNNAVETLSAHMFEKRDYPKLKERLEKEKKYNQKKRLENLDFNIDEFIQMYPDPKEHFYNEERDLSANYKKHAFLALKNSFPMLRTGYIKTKMEEHNGHFTPAYRELEKVAQVYYRDPTKVRKHKRFRKTFAEEEPMPDDADEIFYRELMYTRREPEILGLIQLKKDERKRKIDRAQERGGLQDCSCCYDDQLLFEDMLPCTKGHLFCTECVRRSSEEIIGQSKAKFPCLEGNCEAEFSIATLQKALKPQMFSVMLRKIQEEEIRQADIEDLVACPFCSFATIMPNPDDKVLCCKNPECLKESCRLCQEPNHVPLRCEEVEKQGETDMRTFIEMRMTEAMLRTCWKCKRRFFKTEGCNKMTCVCGASMCYVCQKPIETYDHFNNPRCAEVHNVFDLHGKEMMQAAIEAKENYEREHPGIQLKYDPIKILNEMKDKFVKNGRSSVLFQFAHTAHQFPPDDYYEEDEEEVEEDDYWEDEEHEDYY